MDEENKTKTGPIRPYEVDGIQECDNPLPKWWVGLFVFGMVFAVVYLVYYHVLGKPDHIDEFNQFMADRSQAAAVANSEAEEEAAGSSLEDRLASADMISAGQELFSTNCMPCHNAKGEGGIGPNLTDDMWIHGGKPEDIIHVIETGVLEKGMPPWKDVLGRKKVEQLAALIVSWRGLNLPGKAAEGEPYSQ